ncbi:MAG: S8 family peptidase [Candidatus Cloacimonetes bacterium]|nr:S8 family peptidase [Candidatus Cloacimonadota bacterium]
MSADSNYKYWVQFTDKFGTQYTLDNPSQFLSEKSIQRREKQGLAIDSTDLPVNKTYIDSVLSYGASLHTTSKWFNGITVAVSDTTVISFIQRLSFVSNVEKTFVPNMSRSAKIDERKFTKKSVSISNRGYGNSFSQINMHNGTWLHQAGFKGHGMQIAVLDAGFLNVNTNRVFAQARNNGQILGTRDFVNSSSDIYQENYHGSQVFSILAANDYDNFIGTAPEASYWLIRTEDANSEFPVEMDNMVSGMEFADSVGVDIITSSLGYFFFDDSTMNLSYNHLDGKTYRASIAQTLCVKKGMVVVTSAGNEGAKEWHYIVVPADADSIIAVGAVTSALERSAFSSCGPAADGRIKPTVVALGTGTAVINELGDVSANSGTSMATPIISGLAACLWQALPTLSNVEIIDLIKRHSSKYDAPDNEIGYGIPDFYGAYMSAAQNNTTLLNSVDLVTIYPDSIKDTLTINIDPSVVSRNPEFSLFSMTGKRKKKLKLVDTRSVIDLSELKDGAYMLVIKLGDITIFRHKLIKE